MDPSTLEMLVLLRFKWDLWGKCELWWKDLEILIVTRSYMWLHHPVEMICQYPVYYPHQLHRKLELVALIVLQVLVAAKQSLIKNF
jgi:hypothetical protein